MSKEIGPQDSELIAQYRNGYEPAFGLLVDRHKRKIYTSIFLIVKDQEVAEDILQEVFVKVVNTVLSDKYNEEGKFLPWVMRVAHNMAIDHFRKSKRHPMIQMEDGSNVFNSLRFAEDSIEDQTMRDENIVMIKRLIEELPESQKEVLVMRFYVEMSFQEIAEKTGVSINTALGRMRYALIHLRKKMKQLNVAYDKTIYPK
jgi:RNA polymerase sigma-70 factor (ECF subfamily)